MDKLRRGIRQNGQALAEYMPLIAGFFAVSIFVVWVFGANLADIYGDVVSKMFGVEGSGQGQGESGQSQDPQCVDWWPDLGASECDKSEDCDLREYEDGHHGTLVSEDEDPIEEFVIKAGQDYIVYSGQGDHDDGCYQVSIVGSIASWAKIGSGQDCRHVSHVQAWKKHFCVPQ